LSKKFIKKWEETGEGGLKDTIYPPKPLRPRILKAIQKVNSQVQRLNNVSEELTQREKALFTKLIDAYERHDDERAKMFANEIAEIRKNHKFMIHSSIALEQVLLRLRTVSELGDMVSTLSPAVEVLSKVRSELTKVMPSAERELDEVGVMLNELIAEASQRSGFNFNFEVSNTEARKILEEAAAIAEQRMKEKFPSLPSEPASAGWSISQSGDREGD